MSTQPAIRLHDVRFAYDSRPDSFELRVDDLEVAPGARVACIGPSGCGKTTLVNLIAGIARPGAGRVEVGGATVSELGDAQRRALRIRTIGMVFQEFALLDYLTAIENILLPYFVSSALRLGGPERERAATISAQLGIDHCLRRRPRRLSHGERQRVAIARALVTEPSLLICDEPTGNLDPQATAATCDLLFEQAGRCGATLLVVTHDHDLLSRFDRVIDMKSLSGAGGAGAGA